MNRQTSALLFVLFGAGACSIINATEDLKPGDDGTGAVDTGGSSTTAGSKSGGSTTGAMANVGGANGDTSMAGAGAVVGMGGCGSDCTIGGAPPIGRACDVSADDCSGAAPICDSAAGECRACANDQECTTEVGKDFCASSGAVAGRCVVCKTNDSCAGITPICNNVGACRGCISNDECDSGVCDSKGSCGLPAATVYALAETGVGDANCGTIDKPCSNVSFAASKLTAIRHNLVLLKTIKKFIDPLTLPAVKGLRVIGNGVSISPYDGKSAITVPAGADVSFDDMLVSNSTIDGAGGIVCTNAAITVTSSTLQDNLTGILATDCDVTVMGSLIKHNTPNADFGTAGIKSTCAAAHCAKTLSLLRNKFVDNGVAVYLYDQVNANIENNLFLRNGFEQYTRVIQLNSDATHFAYNTLVENFNNGIFIGIVACGGTCTDVGNISFNNFPGHPEYGDQVFYGGTLTYNLTEVTYPGVTNKTGDPKFVDAANGNFTPGAGSPAIDKGDPKDFPMFDINGNKRPGGNGPDMGAYESQ
jgi:Periplasmic copper-binding protein (NosD)